MNKNKSTSLIDKEYIAFFSAFIIDKMFFFIHLFLEIFFFFDDNHWHTLESVENPTLKPQITQTHIVQIKQ